MYNKEDWSLQRGESRGFLWEGTNSFCKSGNLRAFTGQGEAQLLPTVIHLLPPNPEAQTQSGTFLVSLPLLYSPRMWSVSRLTPFMRHPFMPNDSLPHCFTAWQLWPILLGQPCPTVHPLLSSRLISFPHLSFQGLLIVEPSILQTN